MRRFILLALPAIAIAAACSTANAGGFPITAYISPEPARLAAPTEHTGAVSEEYAAAEKEREQAQVLALVGKRKRLRKVDLVTVVDEHGNTETCTDGSCSSGQCSSGACSSGCSSGNCGPTEMMRVRSKAQMEHEDYGSGSCGAGGCGSSGMMSRRAMRRMSRGGGCGAGGCN